MKVFRFQFVLFFILFSSQVLSATASTKATLSFTADQKKIMLEAFSGVTVTNSMRKRFWRGVPIGAAKKAMPEFMLSMKSMCELVMLKQTAFWESALVSYDTQKVYVSPSLTQYRKMFRDGILPLKFHSKNLKNTFLTRLAPFVLKAEESEDQILTASAAHDCTYLPSTAIDESTERFCPTREYIETILEQIKYKIRNFEKLFKFS